MVSLLTNVSNQFEFIHKNGINLIIKFLKSKDKILKNNSIILLHSLSRYLDNLELILNNIDVQYLIDLISDNDDELKIYFDDYL